ncbi:MAG: hypothetical protein JWM31_2013 [Solirubrobacterales bacterium]|nr:hypothetical protein [Solirubrobacterales bacterium]
MADRTAPAVTPTTPRAGRRPGSRDVGLVDGTRLTEERAAEVVDEVRRRVGRPSLTGEAVTAPRITFRIPLRVRDGAAEIAAREGKTISQLAREALEERVAPEGRRS